MECHEVHRLWEIGPSSRHWSGNSSFSTGYFGALGDLYYRTINMVINIQRPDMGRVSPQLKLADIIWTRKKDKVEHG